MLGSVKDIRLPDETEFTSSGIELEIVYEAEPDRDRFDIDVAARGGAGGVLGRLIGTTTRPVGSPRRSRFGRRRTGRRIPTSLFR